MTIVGWGVPHLTHPARIGKYLSTVDAQLIRRRRDVQAGLRGIVRNRDAGRFGAGSLRDASPQSRLELGGKAGSVMHSRTQTLSRAPGFGNDVVPAQTPSPDASLKHPFKAREPSGLHSAPGHCTLYMQG